MTKSLSSQKIVCRKLLSKNSPSSKSSSRKASSRKSSSRKSSSKNMLLTASTMKYESYRDNYYRPMCSCIISIIINILILYYVVNLEDVTCNCITDWRHNYIKYVTIFILIMNILFLFSLRLSNDNPIMSLFLILTLINMYALYTYVGDLNDTKCGCAVVKQKDLNTFLYYYRYIFIIVPIVFIIGVLILLSTLM
jgi:hypothetical protein